MAHASDQDNSAQNLRVDAAQDLPGVREADAPVEAATYLAALVESSNDAIISQDLNGIITSWNKAAERIYGFCASEIVGRPIGTIIPPDRVAEESTILERLRGGQQTEQLETVRLRKDGSPVNISLTVSPIRNRKGEVIGASKIARDITERKRSEQTLRERELMFRATFNNAAVGIAHVGLDGQWLRFNDRFCVLTGYNREELGNLTFQDITHPDDLEVDLAYAARLSAGEISHYDMDKRYLRKDGSVVWAHLTGSVVRGATGTPDYFIAIVQDITERKAAEESLRQSENRFATAFRASPDALVISTLSDGTVREVNETFLHLFGLERHEVIGHSSAELKLFADMTDREWFVRRLEKEGRLRDAEVEIRTRAGEIRTVLLTAEPIEMGGDRLVLSIICDVTERKRNEAVVRRSAAADAFRVRLNDVFRPLTVPEEIQEQAARELGLYLRASRVHYAEISPDAQWATVHADFCDGVSSVMGRYRLEDYGKTLAEEVRLGRTLIIRDVANDPRLNPAEKAATASLDLGAYVMVPLAKDGRPVATLLVHQSVPRDWTQEEVQLIEEAAARTWEAVERGRTGIALRQSEEMFRTLADNMSQFAWMADEEGAIFWYNRRWFEYTGTTIEEVQGWGWKKVHHPDHVGRVVESFRRSLARGEAWEETFPLRGTDGNYRWFLARTIPIRGEEGNVVRWFGTNTDISDLRETEEALRVAHEELQLRARGLEATVAQRTAALQETIEELEAFSYSLSHDMRAPLRAMQGFSRILEEEFAEQLGPEGNLYVDKIALAAARLDRLIRDVLAYSRIVRGQVELGPTNAENLLRRLIDENPSLQPPQAEIEIISPLLPVRAYEAYLTQVLSNLIYNAVKFVPAGQQPRIRVWTEARDGAVRLLVQDNGIGIARDAQKQLFKMFQRLHTQGSYEGTGIGLSIVRKAVERMGGQVGVESAPGKGSTFWVQLRKA
jgi:PAS domain S-box-containing protein